jgi:hypothetical protein
MPVSVRRAGPRALIGISILGALLIGASSAEAGPKKPSPGKEFRFEATAGEFRGATDHGYTLTLTNLTGTQQVGSANIPLPSGLSIFPVNPNLPFDAVTNPYDISLDAATVSRGGRWAVNGTTLELRDLNSGPVAPSNVVTVTIDAHMPCTGSSLDYTGGTGVTAKQSNDYSSASPDGNILTLAKSGNVLSTTLSGDCTLNFTKQPGTTEKNTQIRASAFGTGTDLVTVEARDATNQLMTWFEGPITLTPNHGGFTASTPTVSADDGVAAWSNIVIAEPGLYTLNASAEGAAGTSYEFEIPVFVTDCLVGNCSFAKQVGGDGSALSLTGLPSVSGGKLVLSPNLGNRPSCAGYDAPSTAFYKFELTQEAAQTAQLFHSKQNALKVGGQSKLQVCFASPVDFTPKAGTNTVPFDYDGNGPSDAGRVGLLSDCADLPDGDKNNPCVESRTGTSGGGVVITFTIPPAWHDPACR